MLALRGVGMRYGWAGPWVLRGVDVALQPGRLVEVRGANGSGKSTLLRLLAGATRPRRGERAAQPGLAIGYAPDGLGPPPLSAAAFLRHHARLRAARGAPAGEVETEVGDLAERLDCANLLGLAMPALSKGSLRKVVLVQALLARPRLLVLDEPFEGLDATAQRELAAILGERRAGGAAVAYSDHRRAVAGPAVDAVWTVGGGEVRADEARAGDWVVHGGGGEASFAARRPRR